MSNNQLNEIAPLFTPPYYAVIFTSTRMEGDTSYGETADRMMALAQQQMGFLGVDSAREDIGITVSYWRDLEAIKQWKANAEHLEAQKNGRLQWYKKFTVRIAKVEREYAL